MVVQGLLSRVGGTATALVAAAAARALLALFDASLVVALLVDLELEGP